MNPLKAQQEIRNNATELSDYLSDLKSWGNDMEKKEKKAKQKKTQKKSKNDDMPPIRNQLQTAAKLKKNV